MSDRLAKDPLNGENYYTGKDMTFKEWKESFTPEQKQAFEVNVRKYRNKASDKKQYERYIKRLGAENLPETFDKFQMLKYTNIEKWGELQYYYRNIAGRPIEYVKIDRELEKMGIKFGSFYPVDKTIVAYILPDPDSKNDPYHIMSRMKDRSITDDEIRTYKNNAFIMEKQWRGRRICYYSEEGMSVITNSNKDWYYKTAWKKEDFGEDVENILKVVNKYVK